MAWLRRHLLGAQPARMMGAFLDVCRAAVRLHRLHFLREHADELARRSPPPQALTHGRWTMSDVAPGALIGFYDVEWRAGLCFRWSRPIAALRLALEPGPWRLEVDTRGLRPAPVPGLRALWSGSLSAVRQGPHGFSLELRATPDAADPGTPQLVVLTCPPLRAAAPDTRRLGLPLFGVEISRA
jgi:hypothetical protein